MLDTEKMTNEGLFIAYMMNRDSIAKCGAENKSIEEEWRKRKSGMMDKYQRGELKMKLEVVEDEQPI